MEAFKKLTEGVYVIPSVLSNAQISAILSSEVQRALSMHHQDEGGHYDPGYLEDEPDERSKKDKKKRPKKPVKTGTPKKKNVLPHVAQAVWRAVRGLQLGDIKLCGVDEHMKLYRLGQGGGVSPHRDQDFAGPNGSTARISVLVYLNDDYSGGETIFRKGIVAPHLPPGACLVFRHDVLHEGAKVLLGTKYVLKTDIFCH
jgi:hypothetical protein